MKLSLLFLGLSQEVETKFNLSTCSLERCYPFSDYLELLLFTVTLALRKQYLLLLIFLPGAMVPASNICNSHWSAKARILLCFVKLPTTTKPKENKTVTTNSPIMLPVTALRISGERQIPTERTRSVESKRKLRFF